MRREILAAVLAVAVTPLALAPTAVGTGGHEVVRVLANSDAYLVALSASCPGPAYDPTDPLDADCWLAHDVLGYDGWTGAYIRTDGHWDHPWTCRVVASIAGPLVNGLPTPADLVASDSLIVGIDSGYDFPEYYGDRFRSRSLASVQYRVSAAVFNADVGAAAATPQWFAESIEYGAQPVVSGPYAGFAMILWYEGNADATVECTF